MSKKHENLNLQCSTIGNNSQMLPISCEAKRNSHVKYIQRSSNSKQTQCQKIQENSRLVNSTVSNFSNYRNLNSQKEVELNNHYFWPTDLVQDESGAVMRSFKQYIENHKINSYIKLKIDGTSERRSNTAPRKIQNSYQNQKISTKRNNRKGQCQEDMMEKVRGQSQRGHFNRQRTIQIDYEVISIDRQIQRQYPVTRKKSSTIKYDEQDLIDIKIGNNFVYLQSKKSHKESSQSINTRNKKSQKIHHKANILMPANSLNIVSNQILNKQEDSAPKYRTLQINQKQYFTPNASTYFQTTNSLQNPDMRDYDNFFFTKGAKKGDINFVQTFQHNNTSKNPRNKGKNRVNLINNNHFLQDNMHSDSNNEQQTFAVPVQYKNKKNQSSTRKKNKASSKHHDEIPIRSRQAI